MALCSDLIVAEDRAKIGYPPARVWGVPTTALWAHRIGLGARQAAAADRRLDRRDDGASSGGWPRRRRRAPSSTASSRRCSSAIARLPGQPARHAQARWSTRRCYAQGLYGDPGAGVFFDGIARHTPEGYEFARQAAEDGYREAVRAATSRSATTDSHEPGRPGPRHPRQHRRTELGRLDLREPLRLLRARNRQASARRSPPASSRAGRPRGDSSRTCSSPVDLAPSRGSRASPSASPSRRFAPARSVASPAPGSAATTSRRPRRSRRADAGGAAVRLGPPRSRRPRRGRARPRRPVRLSAEHVPAVADGRGEARRAARGSRRSSTSAPGSALISSARVHGLPGGHRRVPEPNAAGASAATAPHRRASPRHHVARAGVEDRAAIARDRRSAAAGRRACRRRRRRRSRPCSAGFRRRPCPRRAATRSASGEGDLEVDRDRGLAAALAPRPVAAPPRSGGSDSNPAVWTIFAPACSAASP